MSVSSIKNLGSTPLTGAVVLAGTGQLSSSQIGQQISIGIGTLQAVKSLNGATQDLAIVPQNGMGTIVYDDQGGLLLNPYSPATGTATSGTMVGQNMPTLAWTAGSYVPGAVVIGTDTKTYVCVAPSSNAPPTAGEWVAIGGGGGSSTSISNGTAPNIGTVAVGTDGNITLTNGTGGGEISLGDVSTTDPTSTIISIGSRSTLKLLNSGTVDGANITFSTSQDNSTAVTLNNNVGVAGYNPPDGQTGLLCVQAENADPSNYYGDFGAGSFQVLGANVDVLNPPAGGTVPYIGANIVSDAGTQVGQTLVLNAGGVGVANFATTIGLNADNVEVPPTSAINMLNANADDSAGIRFYTAQDNSAFNTLNTSVGIAGYTAPGTQTSLLCVQGGGGTNPNAYGDFGVGSLVLLGSQPTAITPPTNEALPSIIAGSATDNGITTQGITINAGFENTSGYLGQVAFYADQILTGIAPDNATKLVLGTNGSLILPNYTATGSQQSALIQMYGDQANYYGNNLNTTAVSGYNGGSADYIYPVSIQGEVITASMLTWTAGRYTQNEYVQYNGLPYYVTVPATTDTPGTTSEWALATAPDYTNLAVGGLGIAGNTTASIPSGATIPQLSTAYGSGTQTLTVSAGGSGLGGLQTTVNVVADQLLLNGNPLSTTGTVSIEPTANTGIPLWDNSKSYKSGQLVYYQIPATQPGSNPTTDPAQPAPLSAQLFVCCVVASTVGVVPNTPATTGNIPEWALVGSQQTMSWAGQWTNAQAYSIGQLVEQVGGTIPGIYVAITPSPQLIPGSGTLNSYPSITPSRWAPIAITAGSSTTNAVYNPSAYSATDPYPAQTILTDPTWGTFGAITDVPASTANTEPWYPGSTYWKGVSYGYAIYKGTTFDDTGYTPYPIGTMLLLSGGLYICNLAYAVPSTVAPIVLETYFTLIADTTTSNDIYVSASVPPLDYSSSQIIATFPSGAISTTPTPYNINVYKLPNCPALVPNQLYNLQYSFNINLPDQLASILDWVSDSYTIQFQFNGTTTTPGTSLQPTTLFNLNTQPHSTVGTQIGFQGSYTFLAPSDATYVGMFIICDADPTATQWATGTSAGGNQPITLQPTAGFPFTSMSQLLTGYLPGVSPTNFFVPGISNAFVLTKIGSVLN